MVYRNAVRGNTVTKNAQHNIRATGSGNAIDENVISNSINGIHMPDGGNFYSRNRASNHTTHFTNPAVNIDGGDNLAPP